MPLAEPDIPLAAEREPFVAPAVGRGSQLITSFLNSGLLAVIVVVHIHRSDCQISSGNHGQLTACRAIRNRRKYR